MTKEVVVVLLLYYDFVHVGRFLELCFCVASSYRWAAPNWHATNYPIGMGLGAISILFSNGASIWVAVATIVVTSGNNGCF